MAAITAFLVMQSSSSIRIAEDIVGFDLRRAEKIAELRHWPGLGINGYSLFVFRIGEPRFSTAQCEILGYHPSFHGVLPGFEGRPRLSPENCYMVRRDRDGMTTTVVFADDQILFVSLAK